MANYAPVLMSFHQEVIISTFAPIVSPNLSGLAGAVLRGTRAADRILKLSWLQCPHELQSLTLGIVLTFKKNLNSGSGTKPNTEHPKIKTVAFKRLVSG